MRARDCPQCGNTFDAVNAYCVCPECNLRFTVLPTQLLLAGKLGKTTPDELLVRIAEFHGVPYLRQLDFPVVTDVATQIGEKFARSNNLVPLYVEGVERFVVTDPEEYQLLDAIVDVLNRLPEFAVADELSIRMKLNEYFGVIKSNSSMDFTPMPGTYG